MRSANERFAEWFEWLKEARGFRSQQQVADMIGCSQVMVSQLLADDRTVGGIKLARAIETHSADWPSGPIAADEWLEADRKRVKTRGRRLARAS